MTWCLRGWLRWLCSRFGDRTIIWRSKWMIRLLLGSAEDYEDGWCELGPIDGCGDGWLCCRLATLTIDLIGWTIGYTEDYLDGWLWAGLQAGIHIRMHIRLRWWLLAKIQIRLTWLVAHIHILLSIWVRCKVDNIVFSLLKALFDSNNDSSLGWKVVSIIAWAVVSEDLV